MQSQTGADFAQLLQFLLAFAFVNALAQTALSNSAPAAGDDTRTVREGASEGTDRTEGVGGPESSTAILQGSTAILPPRTGEFETVVHTGGPNDPHPLEDRAASASAITGERTPRSGESLAQLLAELPAVSVTRMGGLGGLATVSLRGSASDQVLVYVDGVPLNAISGGGVDLGTLMLGDIERIEVYRGVSPMAFGASAMGGIVSITTRAPRTTAARADVGTGAFGTRSAGAAGSWVGEPFRLYAGAHWLGSEGDFAYRTDAGTLFDTSDDRKVHRQNNELDQLDGIVRGVIDLSDDRELVASASVVSREEGIPGRAIFTRHSSSLATRRVIATLAYRGREELGTGTRVRGLVYGAWTDQRLHAPDSDVSPRAGDTRDATRAVGSTLRITQNIADWLRLKAVLDGRYEGFQSQDQGRSGSITGVPASRLFGAAGLEVGLSVPAARLDVIPSLRLELSRDVVSGRNLFGTAQPALAPLTRTSPIVRLGLLERLTERLNLHANLARYVRLPSSTELYGNTGSILGNPQLHPEAAVNADLGATFETGGEAIAASFDGAVFGAQVDDLIQYQIAPQGWAWPDNIGRARVIGVETTARLRAGPYAHFAAQATLTDARDTSAVRAHRGRQLPLRPQARGYVRAEARRVPLGGDFEAGVYADLDLTSGNYLDSANLVRVPARALIGAGAYASTFAGRLRVVVSGQNLGESRVNDVEGYPLPGRAVFVTLSASTSPEPATASTEAAP